MKTKSLLYTAVLASSLAAMTSCSDDFFDTSSKTTLNSETAYSTLATAEQDLIGCYDGWQRTISDAGIGMYLVSEFASDQALGGLGAADGRGYNAIDQFDISISPSDNDLFNTDWTKYYAAIARCNELLVHENDIEWEGDSNKGRVLGETRAIRGILYFDLCRMFGDVPLVTVPTEGNPARTPAAEVFAQIFEDFKYAAANIPADAYPVDNNNVNDGRISKYAAEALLARAYLYYTGYYGQENPGCTKQDAIDAVDDIVKNGGYELEKKYEDLFMPSCTKDASFGGTYAWATTYAGKWYDGSAWQAGQGHLSKEFILNLKFNTTHDYNGNGDGNTFCVFLGPRNVSHTGECIASGWGACPVAPSFVEQFKGDPRFNACAVDLKATGFENRADFERSLNDTYEYTGYITRKYAPMCFGDGTRQEVGFELGEKHQNITYYQDWTIMRYADVLLMQSELKEDATGLREVQGRAGVAKTDYSVEELRKQRAIEFAFEGVHFWDLMRYEKDGAYAARTIAANQNGAKVKNAGLEATTSFQASNFNAKKGLMQIPNTQITLSGGVLTQNAGW